MSPAFKPRSPTEGAIVLLHHITCARLHGQPGPPQLTPSARALIVSYAEGLDAYADPHATAQLGDYATQRATLATQLAAHLAIADGPGTTCPFRSQALIHSYQRGLAEQIASDQDRKPYARVH